MIRVLIVEDQRMAREDMENYIQSSGRYCLAASITNAAMAETVCRQSRCELVLISEVDALVDFMQKKGIRRNWKMEAFLRI